MCLECFCDLRDGKAYYIVSEHFCVWLVGFEGWVFLNQQR